MSRYIHDKVNHRLIPVSGYGSRVATSVDDSTLTIHSSLLDIEGYNYGSGDISTAVQMIAPIETTLTASRAYAIGDSFVYEGLLYIVTVAIAQGDSIVIDTNCELSDCVSDKIKAMAEELSGLSGIFKVKYFDVTVPSGSSSYDFSSVKPSDYDAAKRLGAISIGGAGTYITQIGGSRIYLSATLSSASTIRVLYYV